MGAIAAYCIAPPPGSKMNTQYNTLTLASAAEAQVEEKPSRAKLVVAAAFLVAVAGVVAFASTTASNKVAATMDSEYNALDAAPVNCDSGTASYMLDLPRCVGALSAVVHRYAAVAL